MRYGQCEGGLYLCLVQHAHRRTCGWCGIFRRVYGQHGAAGDAGYAVYALGEVVPAAYALVGVVIHTGHHSVLYDAHDSPCQVGSVSGGAYLVEYHVQLLTFPAQTHHRLDKIVADEGIEWINIFAVDNVLQRICDPYFIGATVLADVAVGSKVVRKASPDEKVGVMCLENGKPSIVEYYELSDEMINAKDSSGAPAYNYGVILNYLFRAADLDTVKNDKMPMHIVKKKIPYINANGELVVPDEPNGYKFEQLVLDMIRQLSSCLPYEVVRENEFAPIKNLTGVDSVETARELLKLNGVVL